MTTLLFVYGTLKQGFPNHGLNPGRRLAGRFRTALAMPLYVVQLDAEDRAPWLMDQPGQGQAVHGEAFEVDDDALQAMDRFEEVGLPGGYVRAKIDLVDEAAPGVLLKAQAYLKPHEQLARCRLVEGPFDTYTLALAEGYRLAAPPA